MTDADQLQALYRTAKQVRASGLSHHQASKIYADYVQFVSTFIRPGSRVLDVGCGAGWSTDLFAERGFDATGIDLNPGAFEPTERDRLRLTEGSGTDIPFPNATFDAAGAYACLEHVPEPARMLDEMVRVVRPGGCVFIVGPNLLGLNNYVQALFRHTWRHRPRRNIFLRSPGMARHPIGNTLPEVGCGLFVSLVRIISKSTSPRADFTMRKPDLNPPFQADNDSVYLCNPLDLTRYFRSIGCEVLRDVALGRSRWTQMLAGGTWVAVRTPLTVGRDAIDCTAAQT